MIREGQFVLFHFPQTSQLSGKLRPALVLRQVPGSHDDWLVCMVSTQLRHEISGVDEIIDVVDPDFGDTGLKNTSLIRVTRLAVVSGVCTSRVPSAISTRNALRASANVLPIGFSVFLESWKRDRRPNAVF
ncbi:MAG: type II toxin-antitoxin system PemK/MazF family toxin [bacterium]